MKKIFGALGVVTMAIAAAACSGGGGGGGTSLTSGSYTISNAAASPDNCKFGDLSSNNGASIPVTVAGNTVTFTLGANPLAMTLAGTTLTAPQATSDIDWTTSATSGLAHSYNCHEHDTTDFTGTVTANNKATLHFDNNWTVASGVATMCVAANNSALGLSGAGAITAFPCESKINFDLTKM